MELSDSTTLRRSGGSIPCPATPFTVRPVGRLMAAEIGGLDLAQPFDDGVRDVLRAALNEHKILVFPGQTLSKEAQVAFTCRFGEPEGHVARDYDGKPFGTVHIVSNLGRDGKPTATPRANGNYFWHTDKSYHDVPSFATILHAIKVPPEGGGTQFADMNRAYDALPDSLKEKIASLRCVHSWEASRANTFYKLATPEEIAERPPVVHPMVRTHPETGRKGLYIGKHTSHIEGMAVGDGRALLYQLLDFATRPEFLYTHPWQAGDLVMWDNRGLLHRASADYDMACHERLLHRTVVRGTRPY